MAGLDPKQTAQAKFASDKERLKREAFVLKANHLEPLFPYSVVPFNPALFGLDRLADPNDVRVPIVWTIL